VTSPFSLRDLFSTGDDERWFSKVGNERWFSKVGDKRFLLTLVHLLSRKVGEMGNVQDRQF